jgi:hypothetical protein
VASCILENADRERICATDVARWDTSFGIATRLKGMVLVYLEGNDGRTSVKHNHQSCYSMWVRLILYLRAKLLNVCSYISQLYFVLYLHLIWGFRPKSVTLTKSFVNS